MKYISTKGGSDPVDFDEAVLKGFACDGGLFVPEKIPEISQTKLGRMARMSYLEIAFEMIKPFIGSAILEDDLRKILADSFADFDEKDPIPVRVLSNEKSLHVMELFQGPTLSFKDIAMGFLIRVMDYLLYKKGSHLSLILATTGDTGPAAAYAAKGLSTLDCWPLYPEGMISKEQERQMTTLADANIHPVGVTGCKDGGDDLDVVVARIFSSESLKESLHLSSVNSINWCRVMFQSAHYAYGYFKVCRQMGEPVDYCVPSGAFGNLFAGFLAREMGIPIRTFICATNRNQTLYRAFRNGVFKKEDLCQTLSSAIDIVVPYNFWRFLYFISGSDSDRISQWMNEFETNGEVRLDKKIQKKMAEGFSSFSISDPQTLATIAGFWESKGYLLDPHGAVAVCAALKNQTMEEKRKTICLATAHPAKFPGVIQKALKKESLPEQALHNRIEAAKNCREKKKICALPQLEDFLIRDIKARITVLDRERK